MRMMQLSLIVTIAAACGAPAKPATTTSGWNPAGYRQGIDHAIDLWFSTEPVLATIMGDHRFDAEWPSRAAAEEARRLAAYRQAAAHLRELAASAPDHAAGVEREQCGTDRPKLDATLLANRLDGDREFALAVRPAETDASSVILMISTGIDRILSHPYAPLPQRMAAIKTRLEKVPALLATARSRLHHPHRAGVEMTPIMANGLIALLHSSSLEPVAPAADAAAKAIDAYAQDVVRSFPAEQAPERGIGADAWTRIARLREGVTMTAAEVKQLGERELARLQGELDQLIAKYGTPGETRDAFIARMGEDKPEPEAVLDEYRASAKRLDAWLRTAGFISVQWDRVHYDITLPPPHNRAFSFASLNQSGVLDANSDARFEVNAPTPDLPPAMQQAMRALHTRGAMDLISAHEALPGHYLQLLALRDQPSKVRKLVWTFDFVEGWAHYCEQAVLDAGYAGDAVPGRARAIMLKLALQRAVRVIVDVGVADGSLTLDTAAQRFEKDGFLAPAAARMEARRGMFWPVNMFAYTYGKLAIQRMRDAVRAREGATFSLQSFHDRVLSLGGLPIDLVGPLVFGL